MCVFPEQAAGSSGFPAADPHPGLYQPQPEPGPDELAWGETDSRIAVIIKTSLHPPALPIAFCIMPSFICFGKALSIAALGKHKLLCRVHMYVLTAGKSVSEELCECITGCTSSTQHHVIIHKSLFIVLNAACFQMSLTPVAYHDWFIYLPTSGAA